MSTQFTPMKPFHALTPTLQEFSKPPLLPPEIYVPAEHQPLNPEDEDDVVPDQHAAFGIQRATQPKREPAWKDLGLAELVLKGPNAAKGKGRYGKASGKGWGAGGGVLR